MAATRSDTFDACDPRSLEPVQGIVRTWPDGYEVSTGPAGTQRIERIGDPPNDHVAAMHVAALVSSRCDMARTVPCVCRVRGYVVLFLPAQGDGYWYVRAVVTHGRLWSTVHVDTDGTRLWHVPGEDVDALWRVKSAIEGLPVRLMPALYPGHVPPVRLPC